MQIMMERDYCALNESDLIDDLQHVDWQTFLQVNTCNDSSVMFDFCMLKSKPWITKAIKKSINIINYRAKFKQSTRQYYNDYFVHNTMIPNESGKV